MRITVFTANFCGWDNPRPPGAVNPAVRYLWFTDGCLPDVPAPWRVRPATRNCNRDYKINAHIWAADADASIYHDANVVLTADPARIVAEVLADADIALFRHPVRDCLYEEAALCMAEGYGDTLKTAAQIERYRAAALPAHFGLWCGGFIVRRHTPAVRRFNEIWWAEYQAGGGRDQVSLPFALWKSGLKLKTLEGNLLGLTGVTRYYRHGWAVDHPDNAGFRESWLAGQARRRESLLGQRGAIGGLSTATAVGLAP